LKRIHLIFLLLLISITGYAQVRIRLFAGQESGSALLTVSDGKYELDVYDSKTVILTRDDPVIFALLNGKVAVKTRGDSGFMCDSLIVKGLTGNDRFSLRINGSASPARLYGGDLQCIPDMGKLVLINLCDIEQYIAGVVKAEGGPGRNIEYFKSQALLVRSYMYKYFDRHTLDRYNLCDNTHCQVFFGITTDSIIIRAARETKGQVIIDRDSMLINSPFHSNCGGETSVSEDVWLSGAPYLKKVTDPYCTSSPNARWTKKIPLAEWKEYLIKCGYKPVKNDPLVYNFRQISRLPEYRVDTFTLPFTRIRGDLNLRSAFFSVSTAGNWVTLTGRGYGHGVGLCQEGAMAMAVKGFKCNQIIDFYFSGVTITDVRYAKENKFLSGFLFQPANK